MPFARPIAHLFGLMLLATASLAQAKVSVVIEGLRGASLRDQAQKAVSLHAYRDRRISAAQVRRLYDKAPDEIRRALEPHGYYRAEVTGDLQPDGEDWVATFTIKVGISVKVRSVDVQLSGPGKDDPILSALAARFPLKQGDRLVHARYESGKAAMLAQIQGHGYLRARAQLTQVEVHLQEDAADVKLHWRTGPRYRIGETLFEGSQFPDEFMRRFVQHREGDYYDGDTLLKLQRRLIDADYFGFVAVTPRLHRRGRGGAPAAEVDVSGARVPASSAVDPAAPENGDEADADDGVGAQADPAGAAPDGPTPEAGEAVVPIIIQVAPAPRSVYTAGISVGTDSGFGISGGIQRRWINRRGHKANFQVELSQRLTAAAANYEILLPGESLRSFNFGLSHRREETETSESETTSVFAMENRLWHGWLRDLGLRALYGDFTIAEEDQSSTLLFAEARLSRRRANDELFPTQGYSLRFEARAGAEALLSDTDFAQIRAEGRYIHPLGERHRGYLRAIVGASHVGDFDLLPPELRFFAGGDRTIRGYGYQELGPENEAGFVIGGKHLAVLSAEYEFDIARDWALAGFVDTGNAFSVPGEFEPRTGAGIGVRWRSPVGLVRLDIARGLDSPENPFELHIVIGPDL